MSDSVEKHDDTKPKQVHSASGGPGTKPRWTSSAKTGVGTSVAQQSRVWFTVGQGVLNEIYFPDVDKANTRNVRFLVTDGTNFFSDEEHDADHHTTAVATGVPTYTVVSTCKLGRYRFTKEITTEAVRDTLLLKCHFEPLDGTDLQLYVSIEPHLGDQGADNTAWVGEYKGLPMLFAERGDKALAVHASVAFKSTACGYVGENDGYLQLKEHKKLTHPHNMAKNGNVGLCGELDAASAQGRFVLALAFGSEPSEAAQQARAGILSDFESTQKEFIREWQEVQNGLRDMADPEGTEHDMYRITTAVLRTHESKRFPGAFVASLSLPWGFARGDKDAGAYHVLWPRDLCETAMGLMACGDAGAGRRALFYLACVQEANGSWPQNMWLDGTMHWGAIQMDGIAMPILLADQLRRENQLNGYDAWPMIRKACTFLLKMGPTSQQDRWEALPGYAIFTVAVEIAALLAAADFAELAGAQDECDFLRSTADAWHDTIDHYLYARGTSLAQENGVEGYYIRIAPNKVIQNEALDSFWIKLENHVLLGGLHRVVNVISPDAFALVRYGLRAADDPRMVATAKVIDAHLKRDLTTGPGWTRSTDDGYGEHSDGSPYDGHGIGRCWPLLAGERGHYALAAGDRETAAELLRTISRQTSGCGMIPEQVWDAADIPEHQLFNGHPAGSGMPLAWAHAEYVKLMRSLEENKVWDMPPQPVERYQKQNISADFEQWTEHEPREWVTAGKHLRMDFNEAVTLSWSIDGNSGGKGATSGAVLGRHCKRIDLPQSWQKLEVVVTNGTDEKTHRIVCRSPAA